MLRTVMFCAFALAAVSASAVATPASPYSLSCTSGGSVVFLNPHVWNTGGTIIPAGSNIEVIVAGSNKPVTTKMIVALKPGETFITGGTARPPYSCTAKVL